MKVPCCADCIDHSMPNPIALFSLNTKKNLTSIYFWEGYEPPPTMKRALSFGGENVEDIGILFTTNMKCLVFPYGSFINYVVGVLGGGGGHYKSKIKDQKDITLNFSVWVS